MTATVVTAGPSFRDAHRGWPWRRARSEWVVVAGLGALGMAAGPLWEATRPPRYEAVASLAYDLGPGTSGFVGDPKAQGGELSYRADRELIETQMFVLRSRTLAERVVRDAGLDRAGPRDTSAAQPELRFERAVQRVQQALEIESVPGTRVVTIRARASTRRQAARIANALIDAYLQKSLEDRVGTTSRALAWLSAEERKLAHEVEASELAVFKYREDRQTLFASLADRRTLTTQQFERYTTALTELRIKRIQTHARVTVLREALAASHDPMTVLAGPIALDPAVQSLRERTLALELQLQQLALSENREAANVLRLQTARETARAQLAQQLGGILRAVQTELKELERTETGLQQALGDVQKQSQALSREELELAALERERSSRTERYRHVLERTAQADLTRALNASPARVIDRAAPVPHARQGGLAASLGAATGIMFGLLGTALALARRRRGVEPAVDADPRT